MMIKNILEDTLSLNVHLIKLKVVNIVQVHQLKKLINV